MLSITEYLRLLVYRMFDQPITRHVQNVATNFLKEKLCLTPCHKRHILFETSSQIEAIVMNAIVYIV